MEGKSKSTSGKKRKFKSLEPIRCDVCDKSYVTAASLKKHKITKRHLEKEEKINNGKDAKDTKDSKEEKSDSRPSRLSLFLSEYNNFFAEKFGLDSKREKWIDRLKEDEKLTLADHIDFKDFLLNPYDALLVCKDEDEGIFSKENCSKHKNIRFEIIDLFYICEVKNTGALDILNPDRIAKLVQYALKNRQDNTNDICFDSDLVFDISWKTFEKLNEKLMKQTSRECKWNQMQFNRAFTFSGTKFLREQKWEEKLWYYLPDDYCNENRLVQLIKNQLGKPKRYSNREEISDKINSNSDLAKQFYGSGSSSNPGLDLKQREAVLTCLLEPFSLIVGRAGTGKSVVIRFIISFIKAFETEYHSEKQSEEESEEKSESKTSAKIFRRKNTSTNKIKISECKDSSSKGRHRSDESKKKKIVRNKHNMLPFRAVALTGIATKNIGSDNTCTISKYIRNETQLHGETLLVDECGMIHLSAMVKLLSTARFSRRIIFCGDSAQLPPVMDCHILQPLLESKQIPATELTVQHRTESFIHNNAMMIFPQPLSSEDSKNETKSNNISEAEAKEIINRWQISSRSTGADAKFRLIISDDEKYLTDETLKLSFKTYARNLIDKPFDSQIEKLTDNNNSLRLLSPNSSSQSRGNERLYSAPMLNRDLSRAFKELSKSKTPSKFFTGQCVTSSRNIYVDDENPDKFGELIVAKGQCGTIYRIIEKKDNKGEVKYFDSDLYDYQIKFGDEMIRLPSSDIEAGYAITVHKSQGLGFNTVILIACNGMGPGLQTRQFLYTAMTRAKENFIMYTTESCLKRMLMKNHEPGKSHILEKLKIKTKHNSNNLYLSPTSSNYINRSTISENNFSSLDTYLDYLSNISLDTAENENENYIDNLECENFI